MIINTIFQVTTITMQVCSQSVRVYAMLSNVYLFICNKQLSDTCPQRTHFPNSNIVQRFNCIYFCLHNLKYWPQILPGNMNYNIIVITGPQPECVCWDWDNSFATLFREHQLPHDCHYRACTWVCLLRLRRFLRGIVPKRSQKHTPVSRRTAVSDGNDSGSCSWARTVRTWPAPDKHIQLSQYRLLSNVCSCQTTKSG